MDQQRRAWWQPPGGVTGPRGGTAVLLHFTTVIVAVLTSIIGVITFVSYQGVLHHVLPNIITLVLVAFTQVLLRRGHVMLAAHFFLGALWCIITTFFSQRGGMGSPLARMWWWLWPPVCSPAGSPG